MMKKILFTILLCVLTIFSDMPAQNTIPYNAWIKFNNINVSENYFNLANSLSDSLILPDLFTQSASGSNSCYWNGTEWVFTSGNGIPSNFLIAVKTAEVGTIYLQALASQSNNSYTVFTKDGWVQVNSTMPYIPLADKLIFDEKENRFILLKGNEPWIYNLIK